MKNPEKKCQSVKSHRSRPQTPIELKATGSRITPDPGAVPHHKEMRVQHERYMVTLCGLSFLINLTLCVIMATTKHKVTNRTSAVLHPSTVRVNAAFNEFSSGLVCDMQGLHCVRVLEKTEDVNYGKDGVSETGAPVEVVGLITNLAQRHGSFFEIGARDGRILHEIERRSNITVGGIEKNPANVEAAMRQFNISLTLGSFPETPLPNSDVYFFHIYAALIPQWIKKFRNTQFPELNRKFLYVSSDWTFQQGAETWALRKAAEEHFGSGNYREYKVPYYRGEMHREYGIYVIGEMELTHDMQREVRENESRLFDTYRESLLGDLKNVQKVLDIVTNFTPVITTCEVKNESTTGAKINDCCEGQRHVLESINTSVMLERLRVIKLALAE